MLNESSTLHRGEGPGRTVIAVAALIAVAAVYGATFLVVKNAVAKLPVFDFLTWRFAIASGLLFLTRPRTVRRLDLRGTRYAVLLGLVLGGAYAAQAIGLEHTPAAVSGFITGLFVVFTPVLSWLLLRRRLAPVAWVAVLLAGGGLALITLGGFAVGVGQLITLVCAVLFALHITWLGEWSPGRNAWGLTVVQLGTVGLVCVIVGLLTHRLVVPSTGAEWLSILLTAVLASAVAYTVQTWAQTRVSATQTAVILTMEPVFAAAFAVVLGHEPLSLAAVAGGGLVVGAMLLTQLRPAPPTRAARPAPPTRASQPQSTPRRLWRNSFAP